MKAWHKRRRLKMIELFGRECPFDEKIIEYQWAYLIIRLRGFDFKFDEVAWALMISKNTLSQDIKRLKIETGIAPRRIDRIKMAVDMLDLRKSGREKQFKEDQI